MILIKLRLYKIIILYLSLYLKLYFNCLWKNKTKRKLSNLTSVAKQVQTNSTNL